MIYPIFWTMNEIEEIKSKLNIVDLVGEYVRLARAGSSFKGLCPFHNEKSPSFTVSEERQMFHCFGCQKGGDLFTFFMEMEGVEFREALEALADRTGVELQKQQKEHSSFGKNGKQKKDFYKLLDLATQFYEKQLWEGQGKSQALEYLLERGISESILRAFRIGFAPAGWNNIEKFLISRGYSRQDIALTGLLVEKDTRSYDRFRERIMFPIADALGRVVGYSARTLPGGEEEKGAKYINTPETMLYHKSRVIYGLYQAKNAIKEEKKVIVVEGNMDVLALHTSGYTNGIAVSGTALTQEHLTLLHRYAQEVVFFFDMDNAGQAAAKKSVLLAHALEIPSSMISISGGKDAADMAREHPQELKEAISKAKPSMKYFLEKWKEEYNFSNVEEKKKFADEALSMVGSMKNEVEIAHWMSRLSDQLGVEVDRLYRMLSNKKEQQVSYETRNGQKESFEEDVGEEEKSRLHSLEKKIISYFFLHSKLWEQYEQAFREKKLAGEIMTLPFLSEVLRKGRESQFSLDTFRGKTQEVFRILAEKVSHDMEVEYMEKGGVSFEESQKEVLYLQNEIKKEYQRKQLSQLQSDLRKAEVEGNSKKVQEIMQSMNQLVHHLHNQ